MRILTIAVLAALAVVACGPLRGAAQHDLPTGTMDLSAATSVPFVSEQNHVFVQARLEGKPYVFVFDTGGTAALVPALAKAYPAVAMAQVHGVGSTVIDADIVRVPELTLGNATYKNGGFVSIDLPMHVPAQWKDVPFGGMVGREFLREFVVTVDYSSHTLTLTPPAQFTPDASAVAIPMELVRARPAIHATIDGNTGIFHVDTGARGALVLNPAFADKSKQPPPHARTTQTLSGRGTGGIQTGTLFLAQELRMGPIALTSVATVVADRTGGVFNDQEIDGNIGGQILQRFRVSFDETHGTLYLRPTPALHDAFAYNRAGLYFDPVGDDGRALVVDPAGPAAAAGIAVGDTVESIDGVAYAQTTNDSRVATFGQPAGTRVTVVVMRGGKPVTETFALRDLL